jgi:hypothetical protein
MSRNTVNKHVAYSVTVDKKTVQQFVVKGSVTSWCTTAEELDTVFFIAHL